MDAITAVISDLQREKKALEEEKEALTRKKRKNVHTTFANNAIGFSNTTIANDVKRRKKQR